jgi:hypothetical protein
MWATAPRAAKRLNPCPMAQTSPSTSALCAAVGGLSPSTALSTRGRLRRPRIVCGTGRRFRSMALRGPPRSVVDVAALPAAALMTGRWW